MADIADVPSAPAPVTPAEPKPDRLSCVDLFSGIGGISLGISPFARVIQYCEWDRYCQSVLLQRMGEDRLDRAPIHSDVRNLHVSPIVNPEMICGGFPCQDISSIGLQKGIVDGARSSMFYEVMRIVDSKPSIEIVFLENVANILNCGIKEVVDECSKRGFTMQWTLRSAAGQGAPHVRNRWFMLACRGGGAAKVAETVRALLPEGGLPNGGNAWLNEPKLRVSFRPGQRDAPDPSYDDHWSSRCQALGNAVVPIVVRSAFVDLALACDKWSQYVELLTDTGVSIGDLKYPYPDSSIVADGRLYALPKRRVPPQRHTVEIVTPGGVRANGEYVRLENYPTPRRGITHASSLTERSVRDLPTILVYCTATRDMLQEVGFTPPADKPLHSALVANVNYCEWMMGYSPDWTRIDHDKNGAIPMPPARATVARANAAAAAAARADEGDDDQGLEAGENENQNDDEENDNADVSSGNAEDNESAKKAPVKKERKRAAASGDKPAPCRLHGMHMYMRDNPGKDVPQVAKLWRALSDAEKAVYSEKAKAAVAAASATAAATAAASADASAPQQSEDAVAPIAAAVVEVTA